MNKKILVVGMTANYGGTETVIMTYTRKIRELEFSFDYISFVDGAVAYEEELKSYGSKVYYIASKSKYVKYRQEMKAFFENSVGKYDAIWVNLNSIHNLDTLMYAKKYGIPQRIIHAHNSQGNAGKVRAVMHLLNKKKVEKYATDFWACSNMAAKYFYPENLQNKVKIINNAIVIDNYSFHLEKRQQIREKYNLSDMLVIGNVGRLNVQKNQKFLIEIFRKVLIKEPNAFLVMVGQGEDEKELKSKVTEYGIEKHVLFAGLQLDIQAWLSAFDVFCFPSVFEGLGISALEAQANGLPTVASNKVIPEEVKILDNFYFLELDNKLSDIWADKIIEMNKERIKENEIKKKFTDKGFNIDTEVNKVANLFM